MIRYVLRLTAMHRMWLDMRNQTWPRQKLPTRKSMMLRLLMWSLDDDDERWTDDDLNGQANINGQALQEKKLLLLEK